MPTTNVKRLDRRHPRRRGSDGHDRFHGCDKRFINSATTLATAVVFFPPGTYSVWLGNVPRSAVLSNFALRECGPETSVIRCASTSTNILKIEYTTTPTLQWFLD
jgi:hypothetical protein